MELLILYNDNLKRELTLTFKETLSKHLSAIDNRDIDGFLATIVKDERLVVIMPNGTLIKGYENVKNFHEDWFSDPDWSLDTVSEVVCSDSATALLKVKYNDLDPDGNPYSMEYYLSLTFVLEGGQWLLALDQNTLLPKEE